MNPYTFELRQLLRSRTVISVVIVAVLAGTVGYLSIATSASSITITGSGFWFYSGGAYHVDLWAVDSAGRPVNGVTITLNASVQPQFPSNDSVQPQIPSENDSVVYLGMQTTGAAGEAAFTLPLSPGSYAVSVSARYPAVSGASLSGALSGEFELSNGKGSTSSALGSSVLQVTENFYSSRTDYLVVWEGTGGAPPSGEKVVACSFVYTYSNFSSAPPSNCTGQSLRSYQVLGTLSGYLTTVPEPQFPAVSVNYPQVYANYIEVVNSSGSVLETTSVAGECFAGVSCSFGSISGPGPGILGGYASDLGLFLPLMALLMAYWTYARPRLTGTFDPVLARPITREGLFFVRYGTLALVLSLAAVAEVLLLDLGVSVVLREPLPLSFLAPLVGALIVAGVGFAGIIYLSAHTFRSTGPVLALGIVFLLVFSLFWLDIIAVVALASTGGLLSSQAEGILFTSQLLAPPQFPALVVGILTGTTEFGVSSGGVGTGTPAAVVAGLAGVLWLALPFVAVYWMAVHRD